MLIKMHLITLFRIMNPHQRCLQAKVKYRNEPSIICLQETFLKPGDNLDIRGYTLYNHIHQAGDRASGGSSIILNNSIPQSQIQLNTNLQAVAVKATLHKTIHVCSLYLPPGDRINIVDSIWST